MSGGEAWRPGRFCVLTRTNADFPSTYPNLDDDDQALIKNLALFLCNFLSVHLRLIESKEHEELLINAHFYLTKISSVDDREVFKITLEYWQKVGGDRREAVGVAILMHFVNSS